MALDTSSLGERIERILKEEIVTGSVLPGAKLDIDDLAGRWGVSITPVRDAVRQLETAGFVRIVARRGVFVSTPDRQTFKDVFDLRIALECLAIESATDHIPLEEIERVIARSQEALEFLRESGNRHLLTAHDLLVHDLILRHCGNQRLVEIMVGLSDLIRWARNIITANPTMYEAAVPEHLAILHALTARDADAAQRAMRVHLRNSFLRTDGVWEEAITGA